MPHHYHLPFQYYGSKSRLAPWIISHFIDHREYIEPFAGSAAVLLKKPRSKIEVLNDLDGDITVFWRVLRDQPDELIGALQLTPYSRDEREFCKIAPLDNISDVERARRFYVRSMTAFNGDVNGGYSADIAAKRRVHGFIRRIDERFAVVAARLRGVEIEHTHALTVMKRWNLPSALMYLDPPYVMETRKTKNNYGTDDDGKLHGELVDFLLGTKANIVLSGYEHDVYEPLLQAGWKMVAKDISAPSSTTESSQDHRIEVLYMNIRLSND